MLTLALVTAVVLGFVSGSIWLFTAAIGALMVKMFPILLVFLAIVGIGFLAFNYFNKR
jgi:hypothetical protein